MTKSNFMGSENWHFIKCSPIFLPLCCFTMIIYRGGNYKILRPVLRTSAKKNLLVRWLFHLSLKVLLVQHHFYLSRISGLLYSFHPCYLWLVYQGPVPLKIVFCILLKKVVSWSSESVFCIMIQKVSILVYCFHWYLYISKWKCPRVVPPTNLLGKELERKSW